MAKNLDYLHLIKCKEINNIIIFTNTIAKTYYNSSYKALKLYKESIVYLRLYYKYFISKINSKLSN